MAMFRLVNILCYFISIIALAGCCYLAVPTVVYSSFIVFGVLVGIQIERTCFNAEIKEVVELKNTLKRLEEKLDEAEARMTDHDTALGDERRDKDGELNIVVRSLGKHLDEVGRIRTEDRATIMRHTRSAADQAERMWMEERARVMEYPSSTRDRELGNAVRVLGEQMDEDERVKKQERAKLMKIAREKRRKETHENDDEVGERGLKLHEVMKPPGET
jgi:hypothetical protein